MRYDDQARMGHILTAAREALSFVSGKSMDEFFQDRMRLLACVKELEIIGEAAARISPEFKRAHPALPWPIMTGMRNKLIHDYEGIDAEIVWQTLIEDIPHLIGIVEPIVAALDDAPKP